MTNIDIIKQILFSVCNKSVEIDESTDLKKDNILDSLDSMMFFMAFEEKFGITIPEDVNLEEQGYFSVEKLLQLIDDNSRE